MHMEGIKNKEKGVILQWEFTWKLWLWLTSMVHLAQYPASEQWSVLHTSGESELICAARAR